MNRRYTPPTLSLVETAPLSLLQVSSITVTDDEYDETQHTLLKERRRSPWSDAADR